MSEIIVAIGVMLSIGLLPGEASGSGPLGTAKSAAVVLNLKTVQTGDLIFRRGEGLVSYAVLEMDPASTYSHVGLIYRQEDRVWVIHTVPGQPGTRSDAARLEPLEQFLAADKATQAAVYRVNQGGSLVKRAVETALQYVIDEVPFDGAYALTTADRLYCTELVWRAYREAGLDLVDGKFDRLGLLLVADQRVLLPSSLLNSPYVRLIEKG